MPMSPITVPTPAVGPVEAASRPALSPLPRASAPCTGDCPDCRKCAFQTRVVVGVDHSGGYAPVIGLLCRLAFPKPHLELIHVAPERLPLVPAFGPTLDLEDRYAQVAANLGCAALHEATNKGIGKDFPCEGRLIHGNPADRLIGEAEAEHADLIAVNATHHGIVGKSYIGSVSRALAIGSSTSVLVAKGEQGQRGAFRAVFAIDGSPFSARCLDRFIELHPQGIQEVHVVSAWELDDAEAALLGTNLAALGGDVDRWVEERVETIAAKAATKLTEAGYVCKTHVVRGRPNEVLHRAMADIRADLLIVGSQGHGAMARAPIGSVSLHQASAELYPVLILRPREA